MSGQGQQYIVQAPDGSKHIIEGPAQAAAPVAPEDAAFAAGRQAGNDEGALHAGISQAGQQATFGGQNYVNAATRYLAQRLSGVTNPDSYSTDLAYSRGQSQGEAEGHKTASTIGGTAGGLLGAAALGVGAKAAAAGSDLVANIARAVGPVEGQSVRNVLKSAAASGLAAGTESANQGQSPGEVGLSTAGGAATGPIASKLIKGAVSRYAGTDTDQAWRIVAKTLKESPDTLQNARDAFHTATGDDASMADISNLHSQGNLRALAAKNPELAQAAITARDANGVGFDADARNASPATLPQTPEGIRDLRDIRVTQAMSSPTPTSGSDNLRDVHVPDPNGIFQSPHVDLALQPNQDIASRLRRAAGVDQNGQSTFDPDDTVAQLKDRLNSNYATIGDADRVRQALRNMQSFLMKDSPTNPKSRDLANEFGDAANKVEGLATKADPAYKMVTQGYRNYSDYADGMEHALEGKGQFDKAGNSFTDAALTRQNGQDGWAHGNALRIRQEARDLIAPRTVQSAPNTNTAANAAGLGLALKTGGLSAVHHLLTLIPGTGRLPSGVQQVIARQALDPASFPQAVANMRRAGVQEHDIANFANALGNSAAGHVANSVVGQNQ